MMNQVRTTWLLCLLAILGVFSSPRLKAQSVFNSELQSAQTTPFKEFRIAPYVQFSRERLQYRDTISSIGLGINLTYGLSDKSAIRLRYGPSVSAINETVFSYQSFELGYTHSFWDNTLAISLPLGAAYSNFDYWVFTSGPSLIYTYNIPSIDCDAYAGLKLPLIYTSQLQMLRLLLNIGMSYIPANSRLGARFEAGFNYGTWRISHSIHQAAFSLFWRLNKAKPSTGKNL